MDKLNTKGRYNMNLIELQHLLEDKAEEIGAIIRGEMPSKGDIEEDCQRLYLLNRLSEFEHAVKGITENDLKED